MQGKCYMFKEISFAAPTLLSQVSGDRKHTFLMLKVIAARPIPIALYCCLWPMIPWHLYDGSINPHQWAAQVLSPQHALEPDWVSAQQQGCKSRFPIGSTRYPTKSGYLNNGHIWYVGIWYVYECVYGSPWIWNLDKIWAFQKKSSRPTRITRINSFVHSSHYNSLFSWDLREGSNYYLVVFFCKGGGTLVLRQK